MKYRLIHGLSALLVLGSLCALRASAQTEPAVVSKGQEVVLEKSLTPEQPTVFIFIRPDSSLERTFVSDLQKSSAKKVVFALIYLKTGSEPIAKKYAIKDTPTALVYDRRGRLTGRSSDAKEIAAAVKKAAGVMRIDWAEEGTSLYEEATRALHGRAPSAGILRTMSLKPEYLAYINDLANTAHFKDGYLKRRTKEMIATYVSALNKCKY